MASAPNPSFYAGNPQVQQQQQQQRYIPNNVGSTGQYGMPNGAGSPGPFQVQGQGAGIRQPSQVQQAQGMGRSMSPQLHQLQPVQMAQLQQLPPHLQAQMLAALATQASNNGQAAMQQHQAVSVPPTGAYRTPSVGPGQQGPAKPPFPLDDQQQQFLQQQKQRTASLNPAQMQAFLQAQSQAQAQMQAQAQAQSQGSPQTASPQQRNQSPQNPGYNPATLHLSQQQQQRQQTPTQFQYPPHQRPSLTNAAAIQNSGWQQPPFAMPVQQQQQSRPPTGDVQYRRDPSFSNALAGPSNLSRASPVSSANLGSSNGPLGPPLPLPSFPNGTNGIPNLPQGLQGPAQARRPSVDQIALMQRLATFAQKPGGLPVNSLFTRTSWEALNSIEPIASTSAVGQAAEEARDRKRKAFEPPPPIPDYTANDRKKLEGWMKKDLQSVELAKREQARMKETLDDLGQDILTAQDWLGPPKLVTSSPGGGKRALPGADGKGYRIRNKKERVRDLAKGKRKTRPWLEYSKKQLREIAQVEECLIPIRLDLEYDGRKVNDTFTWNLNDTLVTPAVFAVILCEDLLLPADFQKHIVSSIEDQIKQYQEAEEAHPRAVFVGSSAPSGAAGDMLADQLEPESLQNGSSRPSRGVTPASNGAGDPDEGDDWWEGWRKKVRLAQEVSVGEDIHSKIAWNEDEELIEIPQPVPPATAIGGEELGKPAVPAVTITAATTTSAHDELRILIQLDISVDAVNLQDQFEWDLADPQNSPEDFAAVYSADLGLPGEFRTSIAHLIREQLDAHARSLSSIRYIRGDQIVHDELKSAFLPALVDVIRSADIETWTPHLERLGLMELEHREKERERQSRRQKRGARNNRRNVVALPDREPLKTNRTIMPMPGARLEMEPNPQAVDGAEDTIATYETSTPFQLVPVEGLGPPPIYSSSLRGYVKPVNPAAEVGAIGAPSGRGRGSGKRGRGRGGGAFAASHLAAAAQQHDTGTPPAEGGAVSAAAPPKKKTIPVKGRAGWTRSEMTTGENIIDGKWHCTNCGVPEPIAVGRRKGPAGQNTQCAECSKYWQANKGKLRPCEYTTDPAWHAARMAGSGQAAQVFSRAESVASTSLPVNMDSPGSHFDNESGDDYKPDLDQSFMTDASQNFGRPRGDSTASMYASQGPSANHKRPQMGGKQLGGKQLPPPPAFLKDEKPISHRQSGKGSHGPRQPYQQQQQQHQQSQIARPAPQSPPNPRPTLQNPPLPTIRLSPNRAHTQIPQAQNTVSPQQGEMQRQSSTGRKKPEPPAWLSEQLAKLRHERPDDRFEITNKPRTNPEEPIEFRVKCLDCPGKIYKPGPDETLENFAGHLRFKGHRAAVSARLAAS